MLSGVRTAKRGKKRGRRAGGDEAGMTTTTTIRRRAGGDEAGMTTTTTITSAIGRTDAGEDGSSTAAVAPSPAGDDGNDTAAAGGGPVPMPAAAARAAVRRDDNAAAAEELRRTMMTSGGGGGGAPASASAPTIEVPENRAQRLLASRVGSSSDASTTTTVALAGLKSAPPRIDREDLRRGSRRGKLKRPRDDGGGGEGGVTLEQLVAEEKRSGSQGRSMDETYARNVARLGSKYKGSDFAVGAGASAGADEEDEVDVSLFNSQSDKLTASATYERERSRQIASHDAQSKIASKCHWWVESSSFEKHRLIALGDHVSLVMAPSHLARTSGHCYLVPVRHASSFAGCGEEVWDEVLRFQTSLRNMFASRKKGVLFLETVLPNTDFWQARMDVVPVSRGAEADAPMYFRSALAEIAEEWGTHNKLISVTRLRGLRRCVPDHFPYFYVEWGGDGGGGAKASVQVIGYAQIIEVGGGGGGGPGGSTFPKDFGVDTIGGMMDLDPVRFDRRRRAADGDRAAVLEFCEMWKGFDWTLALDG